MAGIPIFKSSMAVSAADAEGTLTVADSSTLFPGTVAWLTLNDGTAQVHVKLLSVPSSTTVKVGNAESVVGANGFSSRTNNPIDVSAYNGSATLCIETQVAPVDMAYTRRTGV